MCLEFFVPELLNNGGEFLCRDFHAFPFGIENDELVVRMFDELKVADDYCVGRECVGDFLFVGGLVFRSIAEMANAHSVYLNVAPFILVLCEFFSEREKICALDAGFKV